MMREKARAKAAPMGVMMALQRMAAVAAATCAVKATTEALEAEAMAAELPTTRAMAVRGAEAAATEPRAGGKAKADQYKARCRELFPIAKCFSDTQNSVKNTSSANSTNHMEVGGGEVES